MLRLSLEINNLCGRDFDLMATLDQIRAARALLNWSQTDLAERAGLSQTGIARIESGVNQPNTATLDKITQAFDEAGIEFIADRGVERRKLEIRTYSGQRGFLEFYDELYSTLRNFENSVVKVSNVDERAFVKWQGDQLIEHSQRMKNLGIRYQILVQEGDTFIPASDYAEYKWMPKEFFSTVPYYIFGTKMANFLFEEEPTIFVVNNSKIAESYARQFDAIWDLSQAPELTKNK